MFRTVGVMVAAVAIAAGATASGDRRKASPGSIKPYHYLTIATGTSIVVRDELGNSTAPIGDIFRGEVPGVDTYSTGEEGQFMTIPTTGTFTPRTYAMTATGTGLSRPRSSRR